MNNTTQRVALITGSARGLGRAVAEALAVQGVSLFLVDRLGERLEQTQKELVASGATCKVHVADIGDRTQCLQAVAAAVEVYGRLDILCNVAAIVRFNHAVDVPETEWNQIMAVNVSGPFWLCQAAIPHLLATGGNIVNVASQSGLMGTPYIVPYSASKGALIQMSRSLAMEYMDSPLRINVVSPGTMATEIGEGAPMPENIDFAKVQRYSGQRGPSQPADVAALIAFVSSPQAGAIHGAVLCADTGVTAG